MLRRRVPASLLVVYSAMLVTVMVFRYVPVIHIGHLMFRFGGGDANGRANLIPFQTILPYLLGRGGLVISVFNLVGNVALLVPFGFLVPFVYRSITLKKALILAVATGFFIEGMQIVFQTGIFDIDDVILNGLGMVVGYGLYKF